MGLVALGLWLLCVGICGFQIPRIVALFKSENWYKSEEVLPVSEGVMILSLNPISDEATFNKVNLRLEGTSDTLVTLTKDSFSRGKSKAEAMENAEKIVYNYSVRDSLVIFDEGFDVNSLETFRDQKINLVLNVPYEKPFIMERSLLEIIRNTIYRNGYRSSQVNQRNVWVFNEAGLVCVTCDDENDEDIDEKAEVYLDSLSRAELDSISKAKFEISKSKSDSISQ